MEETDYATRREFDQLREQVRDMDTNGTRGVQLLQAQVAELMKDGAKLEGRLDQHALVHEREAEDRRRQRDRDSRARQSQRRWMIGTAMAGLASMSAVITLLLEVLGRLHT